MQTTSALYQSIIADDNHWFECKLVIDGLGTLGETGLFHIETDNPSLQGKPTIGSAPSGEIDVELLMPETTIPKMAKIQPYFRACNATSQSEWLPHGVYFVDTREESEHGTEKTIVIHGFDAMLFFEQDYPDTNHAWPYPDIDVIEEMCQTVGVEVDERTYDYITAGNMVNLPTGYSMREKLEQIAGIYGGNFVMSAEGKLLFVPLFGFEPDVTGSYLADESGNAIVLGEEAWCILV